MGNLGQEMTEGKTVKQMIRGFQVVDNKHRTAFDVFTDEKGVKHNFPTEITLPTRADRRSAGYDLYLPKDLTLLPKQKILVFLDVKAYMQKDEVLEIYIRSSLAVKQGVMLSNNVGIVDASYYNNPGNDGNIAIALVNTSGRAVELKKDDRIAQGIFKKYLTIDNDEVLSDERIGGVGSSGK